MKALSRTDLTTAEKVYLGAATIAMEGSYGGISDLSRDYGLSRTTLYSVGEEVRELLGGQFEPQLAEPGVLWVRVDRAQLERAAVGLRCIGPNSVPSILELLRVVYPGLKLSQGRLAGILAEAESKAEAFNERVVLSKIVTAALDEMFSQGQPILSGIDLESGFVAILKAADGRSGTQWAEVLRSVKQSGFRPQRIVKDAAKGIDAGLDQELRDVERRDDCFHAAYELGKVLRRLERRAYTAIESEEKAWRELEHLRSRPEVDLRGAAQKLRRAREQCEGAVARFDAFESQVRLAREALEAVDVRTMLLRSPAQMRQELLGCAARLAGAARQRMPQGRPLLEEPHRRPGPVLHRAARGAFRAPGQVRPAGCALGQCSVARCRAAVPRPPALEPARAAPGAAHGLV